MPWMLDIDLETWGKHDTSTCRICCPIGWLFQDMEIKRKNIISETVNHSAVISLYRPDLRNHRCRIGFRRCGTIDLPPAFEKLYNNQMFETLSYLSEVLLEYEGVRWSRGTGNTCRWFQSCRAIHNKLKGEERDTDALFPMTRGRKHFRTSELVVS